MLSNWQRLAEVNQLPVGSCHQFSQASAAVTASYAYMQTLRKFAQGLQNQGIAVEDQAFPVEVFSLHPPLLMRSPLILLGGMGPLAGVMSFQQACWRCSHAREIVLYQACQIPSRVAAMLELERGGDKQALNQGLVREISDSICRATGYLQAHYFQGNSVQTHCSVLQVILTCNAAHCFLPQVRQDLQRRYPDLAFCLNFISIVDAVLETLHARPPKKVLVLGTTATQMGGVYTQPLQQFGIDSMVLPDALQSSLMDLIYYGVKAFNFDYLDHMGNRFFESLLEIGSDIDCVVAGCTEIPILLNWLQARGSQPHRSGSPLVSPICSPVIDCSAVYQFLDQVEVLDPVCLALQKLVTQDQMSSSVP